MPLTYHFFPYDSLPLPRISSMGCATDIKESHYGPARRNRYLLHYVFSGKGYFNGTPVKKGQGFLTTPGIFEHYYADPSDPWHYLWVIFDDPAAEPYYPLHNGDPDTGVFSYRNVTVVEQVAQQFMSTPDRTFFSCTQLTELFLHIFNQCVRPAPSRAESREQFYIDYSVNFIQSALHLPITVSTLCQKLGVSQAYLYRIFQKHLHCSPKQYISQCRLLQAQKLLRETNLSVADVGASVGYADALSFSRFFSAKQDISPSEYRKDK